MRGTSLLVLRQHGLYISQRKRNGVAWLESEIPYEELLPVSVEHTQPTWSFSWVWVLVWLGYHLASAALHMADDPEAWVAMLAFGLVVGSIVALRRWYGATTTLYTNRLRITMPLRASQRAAFEAFTDELRHRAHGYLRSEYAQVNPLGPIELQLHRLHWLHHLNVLSEQELRTLSTRLTGRLSLDPLKLMGQDLETPYLN
ncbi:hypothetical protein HER32_17635 [Hymenobacter sp. BT18]|uniref:hypothetical protein n=1 Tax=Hymenobacter TaxID=89966 RepID=UPI00143E2D57|nr:MULTISPECIES: hypothetical protein [Hymenobacter]QIX62896.1 hypothetical protein HER32_17635 [Hymenobacter sp. BT18]